MHKNKAGLGHVIKTHLEDYFQSQDTSIPDTGLYDRIMCEVEKPLIEVCLQTTKGNQIKAAQLLGVNRNTLRKKIRDLGITYAAVKRN